MRLARTVGLAVGGGRDYVVRPRLVVVVFVVPFVVLFVVVFVVVGLLAGCGGGGDGSVAVGKPVPAISASAIGGGPVSLSSFRGRWVVVNFFATWCEPCRKEYPQLARFAGQEAGRAQVLGVVFEDPGGHPLQFHRSEGGTWPIITDPQGKIASRYEVTALPQSFVINPQGVLAARIFGGVTVAKLDNVLAGRPS
jgi:cytochrome c biogenesis protein CcmG, thiol:disulfide interchange protein DsbE